MRTKQIRLLRDLAFDDRNVPNTGGGSGDELWTRGLCQLLATACALRWGVPLVFVLTDEEDDHWDWVHVAALLPDGRTVDAEQHRESVDRLVQSWAPDGLAKVLSVQEAFDLWPEYLNNFGGEEAVLEELVDLVPAKPPKVGERGWT